MQMELSALIISNLLFSVRVTPIVILAATLLRGAILLTGQKREFEDWTRNPLLTILTIIFFPGMIINLLIRYLVSAAFGIGVDRVGGSTTYGELNLYLKVDKPPRVFTVILVLFVSTFLSVFVAFLLIALPVVLFLSASATVIMWYLSIGVLFNSSARGGDLSLLGASLKKRPRTGALEILTISAALIIMYFQLWSVPL